jgi:hypothetical protein
VKPRIYFKNHMWWCVAKVGPFYHWGEGFTPCEAWACFRRLAYWLD